MNKVDSTASVRMAEWRKRMKEEGWRSFNIWLPADQATALDTLLAVSKDTRRNTLTAILQAGIEALSGDRNAMTPDLAPPDEPLEDVARTQARKLHAAGKDREYIKRYLVELTRRDHLNYHDIAELVGAEYEPPTLAELDAYGIHEYERGFNYETLARWWNKAQYPNQGRGRWSKQSVEQFLNSPAP